MSLAPIVLFVFNRPWHTQQTIEALKKNTLANDSELYIFSDGAKHAKDQVNVEKVREYIREVNGFKAISIIERDKNWGLANSIIDGVTTIVDEFGKIIVLEDDLVTGPYFLKFMNDALIFYREEDKVMHISGWNYPINTTDLPETIFLRGTTCSGWATWDRAWQYFEKAPYKLLGSFTKSDRYKFDYDGSVGMWSQVIGNLTGKLNTWAIFWYAAVFKKRGLCLHPSKSLVKNIGHDGSGVHCGSTDVYCAEAYDKQVTVFSTDLVESAIAMGRIKNFLLGNKRNIFGRVINKIIRKIKCK